MSFIFSLSSWTDYPPLHMHFINSPGHIPLCCTCLLSFPLYLFPFFLARFPSVQCAHVFTFFPFFLAGFPLFAQCTCLLSFSFLPGRISPLCTCIFSFTFLSGHILPYETTSFSILPCFQQDSLSLHMYSILAPVQYCRLQLQPGCFLHMFFIPVNHHSNSLPFTGKSKFLKRTLKCSLLYCIQLVLNANDFSLLLLKSSK